MQNELHRVIDVNLNRSREALRVCEDIARFVISDKILTGLLKDARHRISRITANLIKKNILTIKYRDADADLGRQPEFDKKSSVDFKTLFYKNIHRAQESIRCLEEFSKLAQSEKLSGNFKILRFKLYSIEKKAVKKFIKQS